MPVPAWVDPDDWEALRSVFEDRRVVVFAGAGISAAAGLPLWPKLAELLIERMRRTPALASAVDEAADNLQRGKLVEAISAARHALGAAVFGDVVAKALDDRGKDVPAAAHAIAALAPKLRGVVTTNLDRFLERAAGGQWTDFVAPVGNLVQDPGFLWKVHGTLQDRSSWVFVRSGYERVMFGDTHYRATFGALYRARTLLFVGCSLDDDDLGMTLGEVRALSADQPPNHFAVLEGPVGEFRRRTLEQAGIRLFVYPKGEHAKVVELLQALADPAPQPAGPGPRAQQPATSPAAAPAPSIGTAPSALTAASSAGITRTPVEVFVCYADADSTLRDELEKHLKPLVDGDFVRLWHAGKLSAGSNVQQQTQAHLDRARVVLVLTTANLLSSDRSNEQIGHASRRGATIVPVIAQPCLWELSVLGKAQPLPASKKPVASWSDRNAAWVEVVQGVLEIVK